MIDPNSRLLMKQEGKNCANLWCNRSKNDLATTQATEWKIK